MRLQPWPWRRPRRNLRPNTRRARTGPATPSPALYGLCSAAASRRCRTARLRPAGAASSPAASPPRQARRCHYAALATAMRVAVGTQESRLEKEQARGVATARWYQLTALVPPSVPPRSPQRSVAAGARARPRGWRAPTAHRTCHRAAEPLPQRSACASRPRSAVPSVQSSRSQARRTATTTSRWSYSPACHLRRTSCARRATHSRGVARTGGSSAHLQSRAPLPASAPPRAAAGRAGLPRADRWTATGCAAPPRRRHTRELRVVYERGAAESL